MPIKKSATPKKNLTPPKKNLTPQKRKAKVVEIKTEELITKP